MLKPKKRLTDAELKFVDKERKHLTKTLTEIQKTDDIRDFFTKYKEAYTVLERIASVVGKNTPCIAGETPAACTQSLDEYKDRETYNFLTRYFKAQTVHIFGLSRGRMQKAKGVKVIVEQFADDMSPDNIAYATKLADELIKKVEDAEKK